MVVFTLDPTRSARVPKQHFATVTGGVVSDQTVGQGRRDWPDVVAQQPKLLRREPGPGNNQAERALRGPVVGRKNYYGSGAVER